ncbi:hypothetical protein [Thalassospira marina]|uniref:DUF4352 domain-containing protein n=1 Tax=Thalassospira marina TaxID=2048283 RepID=A0A2N3KU79_9PROT|nr:hypothetical protein [Thalassospira marina]PKR54087.1 hypothetical protein COO20_11090 [Thalassospira marina]
MTIACNLRRASALGVVLVAAVGLSACGTDPFGETPVPSCPRTFLPSDTAQITEFSPKGRDLTDVVFEAGFEGYAGECSYDLEDKQLDILISPQFSAQMGPAATDRTQHLQYFVALKNPGGEFVQKSVFDVDLAFPKDADRVRYSDEQVALHVPLADVTYGPDYEIYMGFQLSREQLEYNRRFAK